MSSTAESPTRSPSRLPAPLPLLGHVLHLLRDPWTFLVTARDCGDVVRIRVGPRSAFVVSSPDLVRQVLVVDIKKYDKGAQFDRLRPVLGNGLVTAGGEDHRKHRRLVQPAFHSARIATYARTMRDLAVATAGSWRAGERIALDRELAHLTLRVVGRTLFSTDLGAAVVDEVVRSMPTVLGGITRRSLAPAVLDRLPTPGNRRFDRANRRIRDVVDRIVGEYRRSETDHGDVVSMLLLARDEDTGEGLTDAQVRDEVVTMLMAGTETTANVLSWAFHVLGARPDVEARLHAEVDDVLGDGLGDGDVDPERIARLAYTRRVISETLRLYPPAWLLTRRTNEPVTLGGTELPAGAMIILSPFALHRGPGQFADPEEFDPDRWLPDRAKQIPRPAFIPFGAGNRQCIGEAFAWTEAVIVLATIARRWRLEPVPDAPVRRVASATMTPSRLPMIPRQRAAAGGPADR